MDENVKKFLTARTKAREELKAAQAAFLAARERCRKAKAACAAFVVPRPRKKKAKG